MFSNQLFSNIFAISTIYYMERYTTWSKAILKSLKEH